jgi:hypothetical protein
MRLLIAVERRNVLFVSLTLRIAERYGQQGAEQACRPGHGFTSASVSTLMWWRAAT